MTLKVFPKLELEIEAAFDFDWEFGKGEDEDVEEEKEESLWKKFSLEVKAKHGSKDIVSYEYGHDDGSEESGFETFGKTLLQNINSVLDGLSIFLEDENTIKIEIKPSFKANVKVAQAKGKPFVGLGWQVSIGCDPLIGLEASSNLAGTALKLIPGIGTFISIVMSAAKKAEVGELFLGFEITGAIGLSGSKEKEPGAAIDDAKIEASGDITLTLKGLVKSEASIWILKYSVGVQLGATSGISVADAEIKRDAKGLFIDLDIMFGGITLFYQSWKDIGISYQVSDMPDVLAGEHSTSLKNDGEAEDVGEMENTYQLVKPRSLYKGPLYLTSNK